MANTPTLFLSYCWANTSFADEIDQHFGITGIQLKRDIRDIAYKGNIKTFMQTIATHDFVLVLISNEFVRSANCMYEVMELLNTAGYAKKILPVILPNTKIFGTTDRAKILRYWAEQKETAQSELTTLDPTQAQSIQNDLKHYKNICDNIDAFLSYLKDTNCSSYEQLKQDSYAPILKNIGYAPAEAAKLEIIFKLLEIADEEEQLVELDDYFITYPNDAWGWFAKGYVCEKREKYKLSQVAYRQALKVDPNDAKAHNNYAKLLIEHFKDKENAKIHFLKAIEVDTNNTNAHYNYAKLLIEYFKDKENAKIHYLKALEIDPNFAKAHYNYAHLLIDHFDDKENAKTHYQKAIQIDPNDAKAHNNYGLLLIEHFNDKENAKIHYLKAIEIDPNHAKAHYNYAKLLIEHFNGKEEEGKEHYLKAIEIDPNHSKAHYNYALLLIKHFNDTKNAKIHYLKAIEIMPQWQTPEEDSYFGNE